MAMLGRYWLTIWPLARRELRRWRELAEAIPDPELRRMAVATHDNEGMNAEGAAIFATLAPWRLTPALVRLLVAYQVLFDYLDTITEPDSSLHDDALHLHGALVDALDTNSSARDWYAFNPRFDGGYIDRLVQTCRVALRRLPTGRHVGAALVRAAERSGEVQALNHEAAGPRAPGLECWASRHADAAADLRWWEFAASASSSLSVHMLLALAADRATTTDRAEAAEREYGVPLGALNTLLESLVDLPADRLTGDHSFASYYTSADDAARRLGLIAARARRAAGDLPQSERHAIILAGMVSFYLATAEAWLPHAATAARRTLLVLGEPLPLLIQVLRLRRSL
ncbi:MAG: DUF2600 family protein [Conexibacter sp.]